MKDWKIPQTIQKQTWSVIQYDLYNVVVPSVDSKPHTTEGYTCPCNPKVASEENGHMIVHNSWRDSVAIEDSLNSIF